MQLEHTIITSLKTTTTITNQTQGLAIFVQVAEVYISQGLTQEGSDILAYVMRREDTPDAIFDIAEELWEDLERWICPRVLLDAETFGKKANFQDIVDYILAGL